MNRSHSIRQGSGTGWLLGALTLVVGFIPTNAVAQRVPRGAIQGAVLPDLDLSDIRLSSDKEQLTAAQRKVSDDLFALVGRVSSLGAGRDAVLRNRPSTLSNTFQKVTDSGLIQCYVEYGANPDGVAAAIAAHGGKVELISHEMGLVQCELPYDQVEGLAADDLVKLIRLPSYAVIRAGSVNSEGNGIHRCNNVRTTWGFTGEGRKVGVISDGINGISSSQTSGDIPATYQAQSARADGNLNAGAEGLAMMEIVYDLAPGAALAFSNPNTSAEMVNAINILDSTFHCNIIYDDIGFADEPFFQDGAIVTRINQAVTNGAIYVSAAGNFADQNYHESDYSGMTKTIRSTSMDVQDFGGGDWHMRAFVPSGGSIGVVLQWNDPWGSSGNNYDLLLTNSSGSTIYAASIDLQTGTQNPMEFTGVTNSGPDAYVYVVVRKYSGSNRHLKIASWGDGWFTEYYTPTGSICGHAAAANTIAAGAVRWSTPGTIEPFSSRGPVRIDFPSLVYRNKPDLCGADGVSVTGNGGFGSPFYGTSAATPHIAAICAQVWSADLGQTNTAVRNLVQNNAIDLGTPGWDSTYGYGRADAFSAVNAICTPPAGRTVTAQASIVCSGTGTNIQVATSESDVSYQLKTEAGTPVGSAQNGNGGMLSLPTGNLTSTTQFKVEATRSPCAVATMSSHPTVTVVSTPADRTVTAEASTVCSGTGTNIQVAASESGVSYQLKTETGASVGSARNGNGGTLSLPTGNLTSTTQLKVEASRVPCGPVTMTNHPTVTMNSAPSVSAHPANRMKRSGMTATFDVVATGTELTYQWEVSTDGGATFNPVTGGTGGNTASYTTGTLVARDNGKQYRCVVSGTCSPAATSNAATLTMDEYNPILTIDPPSSSPICTGGTASFGLRYTDQDNNDVPVVTLTGDMIHLNHTGTAGGSISVIDGNTATPTVRVSGVTGDGSFTVSVDAGAATDQFGAHDAGGTSGPVTVQPAPAITESPANQTVCAGGSAGFTVTATGPGLTYQWQVSTDGGGMFHLVTDGAGGNTASYTTGVLSAADNGKQYRCVVSGTCLPVATSPPATLTMNPTPGVPTGCQANPPAICVGASSALSATAGSDGDTVEWFTGGCGGTPITGGASPTVSPATTTTYYARTKNTSMGCVGSGCCQVTVAVSPLPVAPTAVSVDRNTFCADDAGQITVSYTGGSGAELRWSTSCHGTVIGTGQDLMIDSPTATTTYYAWWHNDCGDSGCASVQITVNPTPAMPTGAQATPAFVSAGQCATLSATPGDGGDAVEWFTGSCAGTPVSGGASPSVCPTTTTTYYVRTKNGTTGCVSTCATVTVTVSQEPLTCAITKTLPDPTSASTVSYRIVFSKPVNDFDVGEITLGGTIAETSLVNFAGAGTTYTVDVANIASSGTVCILLAPGVAHDVYGNPNMGCGPVCYAVTSARTVQAVGSNEFGQLGLGLDAWSPAPALIGNVAAVVGGWGHTLALKIDGTVWAWGYNADGQLGDGTTSDRASPVQVPGLTGVANIAAGWGHSIAVKSDGTVWTWGRDYAGQLGDGTTNTRTMPVRVSELAGVVGIAAGAYHSLAVKSDGTTWAWGYNGDGQLGDGTTSNRSAPVQVSGLTNVIEIAAGWHHSVAVKSDGTVWAWGSNGFGQLGDGTWNASLTPVRVPNLAGVIGIAAGYLHNVALESDGTAWAWGPNNDGRLGDGTSVNIRNTAVRVSALTGVVAIGAGASHSLALRSDGTVWAWGSNNVSQLGNGTSGGFRTTPVQVLGLTGIAAIAAGSYHGLAVRSDRTIWAWGNNGYGKLGNGTTDNCTTPVSVSGLTGVVEIAAGSAHGLGVRANGTVWAWGYNGDGQLGDGTTNNRATPVQVSGLIDVVGIAAGSAHSLAVKSDRTVWAWGYNGFGQLGDGTTTNRAGPVQVSGLTGVIGVAAGLSHSLAVGSDGTTWAWGTNLHGELGIGTSDGYLHSAARRVVGLTGVAAIAGGGSHSLALKADGTVWAWGDNGTGQLGDGTSGNLRTTPVQVSALNDVIAIAAGSDHSLALKADGTVWAWGYNGDGRLGDGTTTDRITPVQVPGLTGVVNVAAGPYHSLAVKSDGTAWAWGYNYSGQLGDGTTSNQAVPVRVSGLTGVVAAAGGYSHSLFLGADLRPPAVVGTWPTSGGYESSVRYVVVAFSQAVRNVSADDLRLSAGTPVSVTTSSDGVYLFGIAGSPTGQITATLGGDISDWAGNNLTPHQWVFYANIPGDFDHDSDVDLKDFDHFQACFSGPNRPPGQPSCADADLDHDGDVDLADFLTFQACFNGPNQAPTCR